MMQGTRRSDWQTAVVAAEPRPPVVRNTSAAGSAPRVTMAQLPLPPLLLPIFFFASHVLAESFSPENERLGVAYEFKIHLDAGKEDCYYQFVQPNSSLYVAFQVTLVTILFLLL